MAIWYISSTGSDTTGNGTLGNPYATVSKALTVCANTDTIRLVTGTYTITSTTNINKQVTITSNSGVKTDVILNANCTIYNIQESSVSITYMTLQSSSTDALITIDRMSTGSTVPTFFTGIIINQCNIKYTGTSLELNGTFTITNNTFTRYSGTNTVSIIKIYSIRSTSSISTNTSSDIQIVNNFIYLTSTGSGDYVDRCNSKGGRLTIASNNLTYDNATQGTTIIKQDYFNKYIYGSIDQNVQYNINTRLYYTINNNNINSNIQKCKLTDFVLSTNTDLYSLCVCTVNNNYMYNTENGVVHINKVIDSSIVTIDNNDLLRAIFKIYTNTFDTIGGLITQFDASDLSTLFKDTAGTIPVTAVGDVVGCWKATSQSPIAAVATGVNLNSRLATYTTGTTSVDFAPSGNFVYFTFGTTFNISAYYNATYIAILYRTTASDTGHFINMAGAWLESGGDLYECFYTNSALDYGGRSAYTYTIPNGVPFIYIVTANVASAKTKCYRYTTSLTQVSPDLPYGSNYRTNTKTLGANFTTTFCKLAELKMYGSTLSNEKIASECELLKSKWNIP